MYDEPFVDNDVIFALFSLLLTFQILSCFCNLCPTFTNDVLHLFFVEALEIAVDFNVLEILKRLYHDIGLFCEYPCLGISQTRAQKATTLTWLGFSLFGKRNLCLEIIMK